MNERVQLRCTCAHQALLAVCHRDATTGEPIVHIKTRAGHGHNAEVIIHAGRFKIKCRACSRWFRVRIVEGAPRLFQTNEPDRLTH